MSFCIILNELYRSDYSRRLAPSRNRPLLVEHFELRTSLNSNIKSMHAFRFETFYMVISYGSDLSAELNVLVLGHKPMSLNNFYEPYPNVGITDQIIIIKVLSD